MSEPSGAQYDFIDLHTHSTASDGTRAPREVVAAARAAGLAAIALTDHDTIAGLTEARLAAAELGVRVVAGVELSAVEGDAETHVLGLHLDETGELEQRLVALREMRLNRAIRIVERLNALGIGVTIEAVLRESNGGAVGRPHVARAVIAGGWAADFREAFDRYLGNGRPAYVPKEKLPMSEAIDLIHRAGGLAIVAHPGSNCSADRLSALAAAGMDGVEVLHPSHSWDDSQRFDALAGELDLVRSGGSDWHGGPDGSGGPSASPRGTGGASGRSLGMMKVPAQWLSAQEQRVAVRRSRRVA